MRDILNLIWDAILKLDEDRDGVADDVLRLISFLYEAYRLCFNLYTREYGLNDYPEDVPNLAQVKATVRNIRYRYELKT